MLPRTWSSYCNYRQREEKKRYKRYCKVGGPGRGGGEGGVQHLNKLSAFRWRGVGGRLVDKWRNRREEEGAKSGKKGAVGGGVSRGAIQFAVAESGYVRLVQRLVPVTVNRG